METKSNGVDYVGKIFEGRPDLTLRSTQKWLRLLVHEDPTPEDKKAQELFRKLARTLENSSYGEYYVLSVFRISPSEERDYGELPRIVGYPPAVGIKAITKYLTSDISDVQNR